MTAIHYNRHGEMPRCADRASVNARSFAIQGVTCTRCIAWARDRFGERPTDPVDPDAADDDAPDDFDPGPYREKDQLAWMW